MNNNRAMGIVCYMGVPMSRAVRVLLLVLAAISSAPGHALPVGSEGKYLVIPFSAVPNWATSVPDLTNFRSISFTSVNDSLEYTGSIQMRVSGRGSNSDERLGFTVNRNGEHYFRTTYLGVNGVLAFGSTINNSGESIGFQNYVNFAMDAAGQATALPWNSLSPHLSDTGVVVGVTQYKPELNYYSIRTGSHSVYSFPNASSLSIAGVDGYGNVFGRAALSSSGGLGVPVIFQRGSVRPLALLGSDTVGGVNAVNAFGASVGSSGSKGVFWATPTAKPEPLRLLPGYDIANPIAINNSNTILGSMRHSINGNETQVVWRNGVPTKVADLIAAGGSGWTVSGLNDINNVGQMLGWGKFAAGGEQPVLVTPKAPKHIIVLTHGFQPSVEFGPEPALPQVLDAIYKRLGSDVAAGDVQVINYSWQEAYVEGALGAVLYPAVYRRTPAAGARLGYQLTSFIDAVNAQRSTAGGSDSYRPTVHFIGHSLGTVVNAYAARTLNRHGINGTNSTIEFTVLDSPWIGNDGTLPSTDVGARPLYNIKEQLLARSDGLFFSSLLGPGSVTHLENFYGDAILSTTPRFGQPIPGAGPCTTSGCSGVLFAGADHTEVPGRYAGIVSGENKQFGWATPALEGSLASYPAWDPYIARQALGAAIREFGDYGEIVTVLPPKVNDVIHVRAGEIYSEIFEGKSFLKMIARSPAAFDIEVDADGILLVSFEYQLDTSTEGRLGLYAGAREIWSVDSADPFLLTSDRAVVSFGGIAGDVTLTWNYYSATSGSFARIGEITFVGVAALPVPEASALYYMLAGILSLLALRRHRVVSRLS